MIKKINKKERDKFNKLAVHPLQTWEWGEFRRKTGVEVERWGKYKGDELVETAQVTYHQIPRTCWKVGYWPKGGVPSKEMVREVKRRSKERGAVMVKLEPNVPADKAGKGMEELRGGFKLVRGRSLFTKWSFWLNLEESEEVILAEMKSKTRYNVRYAKRQGVKVVQDNSKESFEKYWKLMETTQERQGFYAHDKDYHKKMFGSLKGEMAYLFRAEYKGETLVAWIVFVLNGVLYYPYGASSRKHRNVQASSRMMWEVIRFGKKNNCRLFDMWGSPGPKPERDDPWYGFWRFKKGFGAQMVEFVGSYDLVIKPVLYPLYRAGNYLRWKLLKWKAKA